MLTLIFSAITIVSLLIGSACTYRLYKWERLLRRARIAVAFKGKTKINRPLLDWMTWCRSADKDKHATGQVIYKLGGTTIAVLEPIARSHGKTVTKPVKAE